MCVPPRSPARCTPADRRCSGPAPPRRPAAPHSVSVPARWTPHPTASRRQQSQSIAPSGRPARRLARGRTSRAHSSKRADFIGRISGDGRCRFGRRRSSPLPSPPLPRPFLARFSRPVSECELDPRFHPVVVYRCGAGAGAVGCRSALAAVPSEPGRLPPRLPLPHAGTPTAYIPRGWEPENGRRISARFFLPQLPASRKWRLSSDGRAAPERPRGCGHSTPARAYGAPTARSRVGSRAACPAVCAAAAR